MGHIINPINLRLSKTKFWISSWNNLTKKNYKLFFLEDYNLIKFYNWLRLMVNLKKYELEFLSFKLIKNYKFLIFNIEIVDFSKIFLLKVKKRGYYRFIKKRKKRSQKIIKSKNYKLRKLKRKLKRKIKRWKFRIRKKRRFCKKDWDKTIEMFEKRWFFRKENLRTIKRGFLRFKTKKVNTLKNKDISKKTKKKIFFLIRKFFSKNSLRIYRIVNDKVEKKAKFSIKAKFIMLRIRFLYDNNFKFNVISKLVRRFSNRFEEKFDKMLLNFERLLILNKLNKKCLKKIKWIKFLWHNHKDIRRFNIKFYKKLKGWKIGKKFRKRNKRKRRRKLILKKIKKRMYNFFYFKNIKFLKREFKYTALKNYLKYFIKNYNYFIKNYNYLRRYNFKKLYRYLKNFDLFNFLKIKKKWFEKRYNYNLNFRYYNKNLYLIHLRMFWYVVSNFLLFFIKKIFKVKKVLINFNFINQINNSTYNLSHLINWRIFKGFKILDFSKRLYFRLKREKNIIGFKIAFKGRYNKRLRNRKFLKRLGTILPSNINSPVSHNQFVIILRYGMCGIKLDLVKNMVLNDIYE